MADWHKGLSLMPPTPSSGRAFGGRRVSPSERMNDKMRKEYYLAYGSNLNVKQMKNRCPDARVLGTGEIEGYRLLFKGSKTGYYLTIEKQEGSRVPVAVWEVSEADELRLDRYEGYPVFYYKTEMPITFRGCQTGRKRTRNAFVYIMHENHLLGIPTMRYMETCLEGYRFFGFDEKILRKALNDSWEGLL